MKYLNFFSLQSSYLVKFNIQRKEISDSKYVLVELLSPDAAGLDQSPLLATSRHFPYFYLFSLCDNLVAKLLVEDKLIVLV